MYHYQNTHFETPKIKKIWGSAPSPDTFSNVEEKPPPLPHCHILCACEDSILSPMQSNKNAHMWQSCTNEAAETVASSVAAWSHLSTADTRDRHVMKYRRICRPCRRLQFSEHRASVPAERRRPAERLR